ncbi:MAG: MBOAT family O-acyltransferase [bacterium]|nr:MBOAT family O-acyltransferase [bacterium]
MVFSSYIFIFAFLPLVLLGFYLLPRLIAAPGRLRRAQNLLLIAASLVFYGYFNVSYLLLIAASILVNYLLALAIQNGRRKQIVKLCFVVGVLFNVLLIGYFKYYDFFVENINFLFRSSFALKHLLLPLGISFFTFQQLSFLVSVYKKEEQVEDFISYCVFVLFFPQLVAGPIVLYSEMIPQFRDESRCRFDSDNLARGIYIFSIGFFKKAVVADTLALFVDNGYAQSSLGLAAAWAVSLCYTLQIYFDFSGYSDMAIGLGKLFNIDLPWNFLSPYQSESFSVFWRRWHITLGRALSSYIYKPLGGSRRGRAKTFLNTMATFLISGLWHGTAWTFVLWGGIHGLFVAGEKLLGDRLERVPKALRVGLTFLLVNVLWVLFRAESFSQAGMVYSGMLSFGSLNLEQLSALVLDNAFDFPTIVDIAYLFSLLAVLLAVVFRCRNSRELLEKFRCSGRSLAFAVFLFCFSVIHLSRGSIFIYFNF